MEFTNNTLQELKDIWDSGEKVIVIDKFINYKQVLLKIKNLPISKYYQWIDFITSTLIIVKNFLLAEIYLKTFIATKDYDSFPYEFKANINNKLGVSYGYRGDFQKAIEYYQIVYDLGIEYNDPIILIRASNNLGLNYMYLERFIDSETVLNNALLQTKYISNQADKNEWEITLRVNLSELLRRKEHYYQSIKEANKVLNMLDLESSLTDIESTEIHGEILKTLLLDNFNVNNLEGIEKVMDEMNSIVFIPNSHFGVFYYFISHGFYEWILNNNLEKAEKFLRFAIESMEPINAGEYIYQAQMVLAQVIVEKIQQKIISGLIIKNEVINELEDLLNTIRIFTTSQQMYGALGEIYLLQAEYYRCVGNLSLAYQHLSFCYVLINSHGIENLKDKYEKIEYLLDQNLSENTDIIDQNINYLSFDELLEYLKEINKVFKVNPQMVDSRINI
ncbi:MAG: tetratricopeptide repeat protein [Candidatus Thorarchaeota archaeon]